MAELYKNSPSVVVAIEAGRKAVNLGLQKTFDVHFADAVCECVHQTTVLTMGHDDNVPPPLIGDTEPMTVANRCSAFLDELEASLPKGEGGAVVEAELTPTQIALLIQVAQMLWSLWVNRKKS